MKKKIILSWVIFFIALCSFVVKGAVQDEAADKPVLPDIYVTGVIYDGKEPVAIVNGEVAREGDVIGGVRVSKVTESEVEFQYQGEVFVRKIGVKPLNKSVVVRGTSKIGGFSFLKPKSKREIKKIKAVLERNIGKVIGILLVIFILTYVYFAFTLQRIADKTGTDNSWLAWIPLANLYLMCEIADKPAWWMLLLFLPYVNVIFMVIIWVNISKARGKSGFLGALVILPVLNFIIMGYLAFSNGGNQKIEVQESEKKSSIEIIGGLPVKPPPED